MTTIARRLGRWTSALRYDDLPPHALHEAKRAIVDVTGIAFAGTKSANAVALRDQMLSTAAHGRCTVIGGARYESAATVAFVNSVSAHSLDFDANFNIGMVFAPAIIFPAVLAAGELRKAKGKDLLAAFLAGVEVACNLGEALSEAPYRKDRDGLFYRGWFNSSVLGPIGAAAAVAKVFGLDEETTAHAIGIAATQAGGLRIAVGSDMKPYLCARAAETGVRAALHAEAGIRSPEDVFEGHRGLIQVVNGGHWNAEIFERIGRSFEMGIAFKMYPSCSSIQAAAEATQMMMERESLSGDDIARVRCEVTRHILSNLVYPSPENLTQAQFSMPFAIACLLVHGRFTSDLLRDDVLHDPALRAAMTKVEMQHHPMFDTDEMRREAPEGTLVTLTTVDGRTFSHLLPSATGKPNNPIPDALLDRKFLQNVKDDLTPERADRLLNQLRTLEECGTLEGLIPESRAVSAAA